MNLRKIALIAFGPAALLVYCSYFAYQYPNPFIFLAGVAITIGVIYMVWSHLREAPQTLK